VQCLPQILRTDGFSEMANIAVLQYSNILPNAQNPFLEKERFQHIRFQQRLCSTCYVARTNSSHTEFISHHHHHHHNQQHNTNNHNHLLISAVVPFEIVSLGIHTTTPVWHHSSKHFVSALLETQQTPCNFS
jgi:hypothetical protein